MVVPLIFLEYNEVNLDFVRFYCDQGSLPKLDQFLRLHGYSETVSETEYENLEPWIQWVTAHTGQSFDEHKVFRLGDIVKHSLVQIWECVEAQGLAVGAVSPMNAANKIKGRGFFIPDPWTPTKVTGSRILKRVFGAICQAVNDNAQAKITLRSAFWILFGLAKYARAKNYALYIWLAITSVSRPWRRAILLDLLLADLFIGHVTKSRVTFATLFLNAAAHIQHHYMFSSAAYKGPHKNPDWYLPGGCDPLFEIYKLYDRILGDIQTTFPGTRIMMATGLHQVPHTSLTFYWRLRNHQEFLQLLKVPFVSLEPRMSRDFVVQCANCTDAERAAQILLSAVADDGLQIFDVDNRGNDLFVTLIYPKEIIEETRFKASTIQFTSLKRFTVFVAIKNGQHHGTGYFADSGKPASACARTFPLADIPARVCNALGVVWGGS